MDVGEMSREQLIVRAAECARKERAEFDPACFCRAVVEKTPRGAEVILATPFELHAKGSPYDPGSFRVTVSFQGSTVRVLFPEKLFVPTEIYWQIAALFDAGRIPAGDHTSIRQTDEGYEITTSHDQGGAECHSLDIENGTTEMIWHEHPDPGAEPES
jgi:hypothetical protein